jgi:hypothetical protein
VRFAAVPLVAAFLLAASPAMGARSGRILASGDSMIEYVDTFLAKRVRAEHFRVRNDDHIGTGISKPFLLDWVAHARKLARSYRPTASVVFIGANDGFPLKWEGKRRKCCTRPWRKAYARRAQAMMHSLEQQDRAAPVYWLTLPAARARHWNRIYRSVNLALETAAKREGEGVRLLDMGAIFTPHGRFRQTIVRGGRRISVRQSDGIHLNVAGARIAAHAVVRRMRRDGLFR